MVFILSSHSLVNTPKLDAFSDNADAVSSSGFLHSVGTISDNSRPQLAPSIKYCKLWCQARALFLPVAQAGKMSASKLIHYFSRHPPSFGFQASSPPDNITLNLANKRSYQSLSDFQTGIGAAIHATLDTEQCICDTRTAFVDKIASLHGSDDGVIAASEVHEVLTKTHDILDSAVSYMGL